MGYTKRKLEELNVMDDFLMNRLASDSEVGEDFCRVLLSTLLCRKVGRVRVTAQRTIPPMEPDARGIRLDVSVEEVNYDREKGEDVTMNVYDIEPHLRSRDDLPRHNRFYQALTDGRYLQSGEKDFSRLPDLYILMILDRDPFGYGQMVYSIRNRCEEVKELEYEDGLRFCYFNIQGELGGNREIREMLRYLGDSRAENAVSEATQRLHGYTEQVKMRPEVRQSYMLWGEYVQELKEEGIEQGIRQSVLDVLEGYGKISEKLRKRLESEENRETLRTWLRLAAQAGSMEEFERKM